MLPHWNNICKIAEKDTATSIRFTTRSVLLGLQCIRIGGLGREICRLSVVRLPWKLK